MTEGLVHAKVVDLYGGYVDHMPYTDNPPFYCVQYSVQQKAYMLSPEGPDRHHAYQLEISQRLDKMLAQWIEVEEWLSDTRKNLLGDPIVVHAGASDVGRSIFATCLVLIDKGWGLVALYVLRYYQDYGMTPQAAWPLANDAVWGCTPEIRAENTPGVAMVETTFGKQKSMGLIPDNYIWVSSLDGKVYNGPMLSLPAE